MQPPDQLDEDKLREERERGETMATYKQTLTVHRKELASPHIDVTFRRDRGSNITLRFTTGDQAAFAQDLRMGQKMILTIEPFGSQ